MYKVGWYSKLAKQGLWYPDEQESKSQEATDICLLLWLFQSIWINLEKGQFGNNSFII